jgi:site-specific recombinase XerD
MSLSVRSDIMPAKQAPKPSKPRRRPTKPPKVTADWKGLGRPHPNKGVTFPAEVLTGDEVKALIKACSNRAPTGIRNRALLALLYRGGLRIGEALALQAKDVDASKGAVRVLHGKGDKARSVGLDPGALALLGRWLDRRQKLQLNGRHALFCTLRGVPLLSSYVRALLPRLAKRAGIEKRVHPHGLRHTHAAELAAERMPVNLIQQQLGHANLAVTSRYLDHIAPQERIEAMQSRSWSV